MEPVRVWLPGAMETSLLTLYGKALDATTNPTVLGDTMAAEIVERIDYDFGRLGRVRRLAPNAAARAKHFDDWTSEFLARHEQATVVDLGVGLDTRAWRIDPGPGVAWYDVDYPDVIDIRDTLFPARQNYRMIGSSVTDPQWLHQLPADQPTLIVAEGLTMYLRQTEGHELFRRLADRFPRAVIAFDAHNRLAIRLVNRKLARLFGAALLHWGIDDPRELEHVDPRLYCTDAVSALSAPSSAALPRAPRILARLTRPIPALRDLGLYLRYEVRPQR